MTASSGSSSSRVRPRSTREASHGVPSRALAAYLFSVARPKAGTKQIGAFDGAAGERAVEVLLDDVGLTVLDTFEPVRNVEAVADLLTLRLDEVELGRVGQPAGDERRGVSRPCALT
jgi:hypothetical protein